MLNMLFGETAAAKLLDYFLDLPQEPFQRKQLVVRTKLCLHTIDQLIPLFLKYGIIEVAEKKRMSRSTTYEINEDSAVFNALMNLDFVISEINNKEKVKE